MGADQVSRYPMDPDDPGFEAGVKERAQDLANAMITARADTKLVRALLIDVRDEGAVHRYGAAWVASVFAWAVQIVTQYLAHAAVWVDEARGQGTFDHAHRQTVARMNAGESDG